MLVQFWPPDVALIDIEEICASGVPMPEILPKGTPGYAHRSASDGLWHPFADRFAGAILLCEMMCWSDEFFRSQVHGDSFFDPAEMHQNTPRYQVMYHTLTNVGGIGLAQLFERCWFAPQLSETPAFWEWARGMHEYFRKSVLTQPPVQTKLHAQIDHTLQELQRRLQHTKEIDDTSALSYLRLYQRMEYELAKFTVVGNTGSSSQFSHTQALKKTRLSSPVDSLMPTFHQLPASTWFVVITIIAMIIAGYVVFGVRPTTTTQTILPQIFVTVLPNNETLTPSYTVVPIHTNTRIAIQISTVTIMPTNTSTQIVTVQLIRKQTEIPTITASETVTMPPTLPPTELPTLPPTIAPTQTIAPVQTGSVDVAVQFEIGSRPQTFEISPAGRNMWMDYSNRLTIDVCPSSRLEKDKHPSFRIPVYDNSYLVDFRVNGAVVWQNIKLEEVVNGRLLDRRLVILGYDNGPVIVGYIDKFDNSLYRC